MSLQPLTTMKAGSTKKGTHVTKPEIQSPFILDYETCRLRSACTDVAEGRQTSEIRSRGSTRLPEMASQLLT